MTEADDQRALLQRSPDLIPTTALAALVEIAKREGIDPAPWFIGSGIDVAKCTSCDGVLDLMTTATVSLR